MTTEVGVDGCASGLALLAARDVWIDRLGRDVRTMTALGAGTGCPCPAMTSATLIITVALIAMAIGVRGLTRNAKDRASTAGPLRGGSIQVDCGCQG